MFKVVAVVVALVVVVILVIRAVQPEHAYNRHDVVVYKLDHSRREITDMQPSAGGDMLYELAPVDDPSLDTIWAAESDVEAVEP